MLVGREAERRFIDVLVDGARAGRSGVLVLTGEAGIGKTALLEHAATTSAIGMRVQRVVGNELERDLGPGRYAGEVSSVKATTCSGGRV